MKLPIILSEILKKVLLEAGNDLQQRNIVRTARHRPIQRNGWRDLMIKLHATKKLLAKLPINEQGILPEQANTQWLQEQQTTATSALSGWHGNLITLQRRQCILLVHDTTRFPLFIPCLTKPDFANLNWWFIDALMNTLLKCGANDAQLQAVHQHLAPLHIDTDCNRSVQGTMNRMKGDIETMLYYDRLDIIDISAARTSAWLADRPCTIKGQKDCVWPQQAMLALLDRAASPAPLTVDNVISIKDYQR